MAVGERGFNRQLQQAARQQGCLACVTALFKWHAHALQQWAAGDEMFRRASQPVLARLERLEVRHCVNVRRMLDKYATGSLWLAAFMALSLMANT